MTLVTFVCPVRFQFRMTSCIIRDQAQQLTVTAVPKQQATSVSIWIQESSTPRTPQNSSPLRQENSAAEAVDQLRPANPQLLKNLTASDHNPATMMSPGKTFAVSHCNMHNTVEEQPRNLLRIQGGRSAISHCNTHDTVGK